METLNVETLRALGQVSPEVLHALQEVPVEVLEALARVRPEALHALGEAPDRGGRATVHHEVGQASDPLAVALEAITAESGRAVGHFVVLTSEQGGGRHANTWCSVRTADSVDKLLAMPEYKVAQILSVLGSEVRLAMLRSLLTSPKTAAELVAELGLGTTGQAYHHLRELERAGYVEQRDGRYQFANGFIPVYLTALNLAADADARAESKSAAG